MFLLSPRQGLSCQRAGLTTPDKWTNPAPSPPRAGGGASTSVPCHVQLISRGPRYSREQPRRRGHAAPTREQVSCHVSGARLRCRPGPRHNSSAKRRETGRLRAAPTLPRVPSKTASQRASVSLRVERGWDPLPASSEAGIGSSRSRQRSYKSTGTHGAQEIQPMQSNCGQP